MSWNYDPMSKQEAESARFQLLKEGEYDAVVSKMKAKMSQSGNSMIEAVINVYDDKGSIHPVFDYLVFTSGMMWKCIHFCESSGLMKEYESGIFTPEMGENKNIRVKVSIRPGNEIPSDKLNGKAPGAKYPDKNVIEDYLVLPSVTTRAKVEPPVFDEDVPF